MIKFTFDETKVILPTAWEEVTVAMFCNPDFLSGDAVKLLSTLSGIEKEKLYNTTEDLTKYLNQVSSFVLKNPNGWMGKELPDMLRVLEVNCTIPKNLELEKFGQKVMFGQAVAKHKDTYQALPEAIAIYLAPQIYPKDWFEKIDEVAKAINGMKIVHVWRIADFFLTSINRLQKGGKKS